MDLESLVRCLKSQALARRQLPAGTPYADVMVRSSQLMREMYVSPGELQRYAGMTFESVMAAFQAPLEDQLEHMFISSTTPRAVQHHTQESSR
jgi:hypothetical protein